MNSLLLVGTMHISEYLVSVSEPLRALVSKDSVSQYKLYTMKDLVERAICKEDIKTVSPSLYLCVLRNII